MAHGEDVEDDRASQTSLLDEPVAEEVYRLDLPPPQEPDVADEVYTYVDDWAESRIYKYV